MVGDSFLIMKRQLLLILFSLSFSYIAAQITHDFRDTPLTEALRTIEQGQQDYAITILSDGLDNLRTSAKVRNLAAPQAVKAVCKGLPVKVKVKNGIISVQAKRKQPVEKVSINGDVIDGFLKVPLPDAKVSICRVDSSVVVDSAEVIRFYNSQTKLIKAHYVAEVSGAMSEYLIHAQLKGYADVWQRVNVPKGERDVEFPTLQMRKVMEVHLREVVVTATKVKFFWRGDTLVYDATAFNLPEGSMLDDLIRQLPGVTMNDQGEIFVNGRKVDELLLGSRTFFGGNKKVLMENLPYYTVKNLKVYEKQTDRSVALGYDVEPRSYVMDVNLKDEYSQGYIGNVEGAVGNDDRWLGRGFLLGFTDRLRLTLVGNANNVNEQRHIGQSDQWSPARQPQSLATTRSVGAEIIYHNAGDIIKETLRADYASSSDEQTMNQRQERFLEVLTPTSLSESFRRTGNRKLTLNNTFSLTKPLYLHTEAHFDYARRDGSFNSAFDEWSDSLNVSQRTVGMSEGKAWSGYVEVQGSFNVNKEKKENISFYAKVEHDNDETQQAHRYVSAIQPLCSTASPPSESTQHNANDLFNHTTWAVAHVGSAKELAKNFYLNLTDFFDIRSQHNRDYLYHPDSFLLPSQIDALTAITDLKNSYDSRDFDWTNNLIVMLVKKAYYKHPQIHVTVDYARWQLYARMPVQHERLHYQRGLSSLSFGEGQGWGIDTLVSQTVFIPNFSFSYGNVWKEGRRDFRIKTSFNQERSLLLDRINFRDDSQPLIVKLGNPGLKGKAYTDFNVEYFDWTGPRNGMYNLSASFKYHHRDIAQSLTYDPATGIYTYKPMNISGAWNAFTVISTDQAIDKKRYWTWHVDVGALWDHSKDHAMLSSALNGSPVETQSRVNTVNTLGLNSGANLRFNRKALNFCAVGYINWRHSKNPANGTLNALDYHYGLEGYYTLSRTKTSFSADGTVYGRRGYGSNTLNADDFILNASVSQPLFKGKLIARIEAFDLLHQLSATQYDINAQGRVVTWYRSLPHYVMAHLVYHWNKNPKKK